MAKRDFTRRLNREDLPTLGRPHKATVMGRRLKPWRRGGRRVGGWEWGWEEVARVVARLAARKAFFFGEEEKEAKGKYGASKWWWCNIKAPP